MSDDDLLIKKTDPLNAQELELKIRPLFAGYHPQAQGAALAGLTALFVAGHIIKGNKQAADRAREQLLAMHMSTIRAMIPAAEMEIEQSQRADKAKVLN